MIKLYGPMQSSARRCAWMLEEAGAAYENIAVNMQAGEHKGEAFLKINPNGKVPVLQDDEFVIWESLAINMYLAEKYQPALLGEGVEEHGHVYQWSIWGMLNLGGALETLAVQKWRNLPADASTEAARADLGKFLPVLNAALVGKDYLVGGHFTLADLNTAALLTTTSFVGYDLSSYIEVVRWMKLLAERPAFKKVHAS